jgi:hypothetical protein
VPSNPALFQKRQLLPHNPAAARCPPFGLQPAQNRAVFHLSSGAIFERGQRLFRSQLHRLGSHEKQNTLLNIQLVFSFKMVGWRDKKILLNGAASRP